MQDGIERGSLPRSRHRRRGRGVEVFSIVAIKGLTSSSELPHGDTVYAPHPTRQMALIGEAGFSGDLRKAQATLAQKLASALEPRPHHVAVGSDTNRAPERAAEVEGAEACYAGELVDLYRLVKVGVDEIAEARQHTFRQYAARARCGARCVLRKKAADEAGCHVVPVKRPVGKSVGAFGSQGSGQARRACDPRRRGAA